MFSLRSFKAFLLIIFAFMMFIALLLVFNDQPEEDGYGQVLGSSLVADAPSWVNVPAESSIGLSTLIDSTTFASEFTYQPNIIFTDPQSQEMFRLSWRGDTLNFTSYIPVEEAAQRFFNYLIRYNHEVIDSLNKVIEESRWLDQQRKDLQELKSIIE